MVGEQPPVNVRGVGKRHNIVRQTDSGFGVDARVGPRRFPRDPTHLCLLGLFLMTFAMGGIPRAGSRQQPTPMIFPGESQGQGSLVGCYLWGLTESDTTEVT